MIYKPQLLFTGGLVIGSIITNIFINYYNVVMPRNIYILNANKYTLLYNNIVNRLLGRK
jgi:hypothetical protein